MYATSPLSNKRSLLYLMGAAHSRVYARKRDRPPWLPSRWGTGTSGKGARPSPVPQAAREVSSRAFRHGEIPYASPGGRPRGKPGHGFIAGGEKRVGHESVRRAIAELAMTRLTGLESSRAISETPASARAPVPSLAESARPAACGPKPCPATPGRKTGPRPHPGRPAAGRLGVPRAGCR